MNGVSGSRLSESLGKLQSLVAGAAAGKASLATIQADLYLDMKESLSQIQALESDIDRIRVLAELQLGEMNVSDVDVAVAHEAQEILFGPEFNTIPNRVPTASSASEEEFVTDLEF